LQIVVGERVGLAASYLSRIENGRVFPAVPRGTPRGFIGLLGAKL